MTRDPQINETAACARKPVLEQLFTVSGCFRVLVQPKRSPGQAWAGPRQVLQMLAKSSGGRASRVNVYVMSGNL
jgi:hypothetical protein